MEFPVLDICVHILIGIGLTLIMTGLLIFLKFYTIGPPQNIDPVGEPLFLTPFIRGGLNSLARELSKVENLTPYVRSYSGFITVNGSTNANMFFWFFPAQNSTFTAPVVFWCTGGPGGSGLTSLFDCNGPYEVDDKLKLKLRENSWHLEYNIIFIDNPIGAGFSFSDDEGGILKSSIDPEHMYDFLIQFYTMFPEYLENDFYAGGSSFGGIFAPTIAHKIHLENLRGSSIQINLKGLILDSPYCDPFFQINIGELLFQAGFIHSSDREYCLRQTELIESHMIAERWNEAYEIWTSTFSLETSPVFKDRKFEPGFFYNYTTVGNALWTENYVQFVEQDFVRNAIHVGNKKFTSFCAESLGHYEDKGLKSVKPFIETLLNAKEGYRVMIYAGAFDLVTDHLGMIDMIESFDWHGAEEFRETKKQDWMWNGYDYHLGTVTRTEKLTYLLVRNVGHCVSAHSAQYGLKIVTTFTKNLPFTNQI